MRTKLARYLRHVIAIFRWNARALARGIRNDEVSGRRLLVVYDLSSQPFSIGDVLMFQEASLVLKKKYDIGQIDFALTYEATNPVVADPAFSAIKPDNFLSNLSAVLQAAQVNPFLGSVILFDSHEKFEQFVLRHIDLYEVWPTLPLYIDREYLYYHIFNELLFDHYQKYGGVPRIASRPLARAWADNFLKQKAEEEVVVTVQLRRNDVNPGRNSNFDCWHAFFRICQDRYPVKFVIIGFQHEIDVSFDDLPNVIIAKQFFTNVEQDLALIEAGAMHMGASSGPGVMAIFNSKPYCFFNTDMRVNLYKGLIQEEKASRMYFATPQQRFVHEPEDIETLLFEFGRMWHAFRDREDVKSPQSVGV